MRPFTLFALSLALGSMSAASAQQRPQDFTLPEPTPSATPQAEGPVDDSGVVPVAPRVIPTDTPSPVPTAGPTAVPAQLPTPIPTSAAGTTPGATPGTSPSTAPTRTTQPRPDAQPTSAPATQPTPIVTASPDLVDPTGSVDELPMLPSADAEAADANPRIPSDGDIPQEAAEWPQSLLWYVGGGIAALLALIAGIFVWRRRDSSSEAPTIEPPLAKAPEADQGGALDTPAPVKYDCDFHLESVSRSLMAVTVAGNVVIKNRSERALRDVELLGELTSAHHPSARIDANLQALGSLQRVGPHQAQSFKLNLRLPIDQIVGMRRDGATVFVPLLRIKVATSSGDPTPREYVIGTLPPQAAGKLQPLSLEGPPGGYDFLRAHPMK